MSYYSFLEKKNSLAWWLFSKQNINIFHIVLFTGWQAWQLCNGFWQEGWGKTSKNNQRQVLYRSTFAQGWQRKTLLGGIVHVTFFKGVVGGRDRENCSTHSQLYKLFLTVINCHSCCINDRLVINDLNQFAAGEKKNNLIKNSLVPLETLVKTWTDNQLPIIIIMFPLGLMSGLWALLSG